MSLGAYLWISKARAEDKTKSEMDPYVDRLEREEKYNRDIHAIGRPSVVNKPAKKPTVNTAPSRKKDDDNSGSDFFTGAVVGAVVESIASSISSSSSSSSSSDSYSGGGGSSDGGGSSSDW